MLLGMVVGSCVSFFLGLFRPAAGPDWMWAGGRDDLVRSLFFRPNGSFRRYGRAALFLTLVAGAASFAFLVPRL
jgi:membrane protein YqaA with SNARE-associated domain